MLTYYAFPKQHWRHLRTTNVVESPFAAVRLRTSAAKRLKRSVTIRLDDSTVEYFKALAEETELPYQSLINLYLRDCAASRRKLALIWRPAREAAV